MIYDINRWKKGNSADICCDSCGAEAVRSVADPTGDEKDIHLCIQCYIARGPGITVCHAGREGWDVYGGSRYLGGDPRHLLTTAPPVPGWLGNPHEITRGTSHETKESLRAYKEDFLDQFRTDDAFAYAVSELRGKRVACWCRSSEERAENPETPMCHLDVVNAALFGVYRHIENENRVDKTPQEER